MARRTARPIARWNGSPELPRVFDTDTEPYRSLVHPMWRTRYGDYDHLARVKEWSSNGGEIDDIGGGAAMRTPDAIPEDVRRRQRAAADPKVSSWLAANAGSGKTHVLAQRVINLLLEDVEPEKILAITFTKAAAANMAKRVFDTLAAWTTLDDDALDNVIRDQIGHNARRRAAGSGAAAIRARAGDARRAQGADHSCLLHAAPPPIPVRSQCRRPVHGAR